MFTLYSVDDGELVVRSSDPADIGRVFRLLNYDLPVPSGTVIHDVYVTIHKSLLTEGESHAKINEDRGDPTEFADNLELPF